MMSEAETLPSQRKAQPAYGSGALMFPNLFQEGRTRGDVCTTLGSKQSWRTLILDLMDSEIYWPKYSLFLTSLPGTPNYYHLSLSFTGLCSIFMPRYYRCWRLMKPKPEAPHHTLPDLEWLSQTKSQSYFSTELSQWICFINQKIEYFSLLTSVKWEYLSKQKGIV